MKKSFLLLLHIWVFFIAKAQHEDNVWVFGYRYSNHQLSNGIYFTFNDSLNISYSPKRMSIKVSSAMISDDAGKLLLLSNGCYIETPDGYEVENSDGLNPGLLSDLFCADSSGYNLTQNMLMLRDPGQRDIVHLFHVRYTWDGTSVYLDDLLHTVVNLNANNGKGITIVKNQPVVNDTIHYDGLHAVRHANGRDWWIVTAKYHSNIYHITLLSASGLQTKTQAIGEPSSILNNGGAGGEMLFSPDGNLLARFNALDDLRYFDFDRCTGVLSNPRQIAVHDNADNEYFAGLAWSADSRYLYAAEIKRLLQFDMWATDVAGSKKVIAEAAPPLCPLSGSIGFLELGPDGMIYGRPLNGQSCMHRIRHPERGGTNCELQQNFYQLEFSYKNMPHFPNFRLGPVDGSACDTLGIDNHPLAGWRYDRTGGSGVDFTSVCWYEPEQWLWDFGDGTQSTERHPHHVFPAPGAYQVCLTVSNDYGSDTKCKTVWLTTSDLEPEPQADARVRVWPNPASDRLYWSAEGPVKARLFNAVGQLVMETSTSDGYLDVKSAPCGWYTLQMFYSDGKLLVTREVLIQR